MPRILVADDNANIQKMVVLAFQERGFEVTSVGNGEAAVRRIPDLNPDLVLADVFMPVRNGYEVCEFVKKDQRFAHIPVLLLVGAFDPLDEKEARRVGADGVLKKPFVPPDPLIAMVMSALEKNPRIAAELAKAKEVVHASPSAPAPEIAVLPGPKSKSLPKFPEPSPEEAAVIYGFGKGLRAIDDAPIPTGSTGPKAVATEAEDEEFAAEDTKKDWRRSAMDYQILPTDAARPALSPDENLDAPILPSEDVQPRSARTPETLRESGVTEAFLPPSSVEGPASAPDAIQIRQDPAWLLALAKPRASERPDPKLDPKSERGVISDDPPKVPHWMDMMAPIPSEPSSGDWMSALMASAVADPKPPAVIASAPPDSVADSAPEAHAGASEPVPEPTPAKSEEPFFAEDLVEAPGSDHDLLVAAADPPIPVNLKDPDLDGPVAVRVTPEPLLVDDDTSGPSGYDLHPEETSPLHSFDVPLVNGSSEQDAAEESAPASTESLAPSPNPEPAADPAAQAESNPADWAGHLPTDPPPGREALAHIPFLTPPASAQSPAAEPVADTATVDAVVRKVLERLESQIHGMLSRDTLKPLVENLLENELAKKEK